MHQRSNSILSFQLDPIIYKVENVVALRLLFLLSVHNPGKNGKIPSKSRFSSSSRMGRCSFNSAVFVFVFVFVSLVILTVVLFDRTAIVMLFPHENLQCSSVSSRGHLLPGSGFSQFIEARDQAGQMNSYGSTVSKESSRLQTCPLS
jgi:hypothetical protein